MNSVLDQALNYIARGWNPVPVKFRSKAPLGDEWQFRVISAENAATYFNGAPLNVGVMLGPTSHGLTDVDLDCAEAIAIAPYLLPSPTAIFGRPSNRRSHWLYVTALAELHDTAFVPFDDAERKSRLLELRIGGGGKGAQTVFPGSIHEEGEPITRQDQSKPAVIDGDYLLQQVQRLAAACLIVRSWPAKGSKQRHKAALDVGGFLARAGVNEIDARIMLEAIARAADDEEWRDRGRAAKDAVERAAKAPDGKRAGLPKLAALVGEKNAHAIAEWLNYNEQVWTFQGYKQSGQPGLRLVQAEPQAGPQAEPQSQPPRREAPWPVLADDAYHGLIGRIVRAVDPHTEADPVGILIQLLVYTGNSIGRGPHYIHESDRHFANLFSVLIGESGKSRKGVGAGRVRAFLEIADRDWVRHRIQGGLSTGEGLIWAVHDAVMKIDKKGDTVVAEAAIEDKRLLVDEREFFQALLVM
jgi:hypothetical protein